MLGWTGFAGLAPSPVSIVTLEERLFELFEAYDLNERKTADIVLDDSAIVVRFSINALPDKSLKEGLFFDKLAASFLSLFGSWLRHLTKFLTHIVEFASQNSQLLALILKVAIFLCCILFLAIRQWRRRQTHDKALNTQEMTVNDDHGVDQASQGDTLSNGSIKTGDVGGEKEVTKEVTATGLSLPSKKEMMQRIPMGPNHGAHFSPNAPPT